MTDYTERVTSTHIDDLRFVAWVGVLTGAIDSITQVAQSIPDAYDLDNAIGAQEDVVGEWVGQSRVVDEILAQEFFGFSDNVAAQPFGENTDASIGGRFYEQGETFSSTTTLGDPEYRTVLRAKIVRNHWDGTIPGMEAALQFIFNAPCTINDNGTMNLTLNISVPITQVELTLLTTFDLIPRPAGVRIGTINT